MRRVAIASLVGTTITTAAKESSQRELMWSTFAERNDTMAAIPENARVKEPPRQGPSPKSRLRTANR